MIFHVDVNFSIKSQILKMKQSAQTLLLRCVKGTDVSVSVCVRWFHEEVGIGY